MPSPQLENGFTRIANELLEVIAAMRLTSTQYSLIMLIWRYSYGFNRKRCYDCRIFICYNLMTVATGAKAGDMMQVQADFITRLRNFAKRYGVHVHVVVHPRKTASVSDSDEVGGLSSITNIACNLKLQTGVTGGQTMTKSRKLSDIIPY